MNIGDRVRLMHHKSEGIIIRILDNNLVEVAIEGDFRIPVLRSEIVPLAKEEAQIWKPVAVAPDPAKKVPAPDVPLADFGIYLAFVPNPAYKENELHLINNTDWNLAITLGSRREGRYVGLWGGYLPARSSELVHRLQDDQTQFQPTYVLKALYHRPGKTDERNALQAQIKVKSQTFAQNKAKAPLLNKEAYLFQADADQQAKPDSTELKNQMLEKAAAPVSPKLQTSLVPDTVDLHLEKLVENPLLVNPNQALKMQLEMFESWLDRAIMANKSEITFIHGVGNGKLRIELHKRLARHPHVAFFKDAQKEKFGHGATLVSLK